MGLLGKKKVAAEEEGAPKGKKETQKKEKTEKPPPEKYPDELSGPKSMRNRGCTDLFCLLMFIAFWLGMVYIMYLAVTVGDPYAIIYGKDYLGNRCGRGAYAAKPKTLYPRIDKDLMAQMAIATSAPWRLVFYGLCVASCPNVTDPNVCMENPAACMVHDYGTPAQYGAAGGQPYYFSVMPTTDLMNRCVPNDYDSMSQDPDRCAFPACDNATYAPCDPEYPRTWVLRSRADRARCEIKFQHGETSKIATMAPSPLVDKLAKKMAAAQRVVMSIIDAVSEIVFFGVGAPILLGFAWLVILRFAAKIITYLTLTAIGFGLYLAALYLFMMSGDLASLLSTVATVSSNNSTQAGGGANGTSAAADALLGDGAAALAAGTTSLMAMVPSSVTSASAQASGTDPLLWRIGAYVVLILAIAYMIGMCLMRKKIKVAVALVKEGSVVIRDRPLAMFFPFSTLLFQVGLLGFCILILLFLGTADIDASHFSSEKIVTANIPFAEALAFVNQTSGDSASLEASASTIKNVVYLYFLFGFLWTNAVFVAASFTALSGSFSHWYFFRRDSDARTRWPLADSLKRVVRYHLGTVMVGAFIIALVQLARIIAAYIDKQTQGLQDKNKALKLAMKCIQCCLYLVEKTIKFITDYCYIYCAMQGTGFCRSCWLTFKLIVGNPSQLAINTIVRLILALLQKVFIPLFCGWLCNAWLKRQGVAETLYPAVLVVVMAYVISSLFAIVFSCVIDTLFVCSIRDKAEYKCAYMSERLRLAFGFDKEDGEAAKGGGEGAKKG